MLWVAAVALAGCAAPACRYTTDDAREMTQDPDKLLAYFIDQLLCGQYAPAHEYGLSRRTKQGLDYNAFFLAITHEQKGVKPLELDVTRRLLAGIRQHQLVVDGDSGRALWCNAEFGFSHPVRLVAEKIGRRKTFWTYEFSLESLEELMKAAVGAAMAWFNRQREVADGRVYAYPPEWRHAAVATTCSCDAKKAK